MAVEIIRRTEQARGQFNGGEILENKPLGFPREGGKLSPYSNLFYWAHAWSDQGSTIGLHPHQGFEILSFVIEGSIEHFDTKDNEWKAIDKGGAQIIRSGNGISHSEKLNSGAHMFQIWFDPNLNATLQKPASYDDFPDDAFPVSEKGGIRTKIYKGGNAPMLMDSPGVQIKELTIAEGEHTFELEDDDIHSIYLISGDLSLEEGNLSSHDFIRVFDQNSLSIKAKEKSTLFWVSNPKKLSYRTYAEHAKSMA